MRSRIITIADAFDAMRSDRPYRNALPHARCIEEIAQNAARNLTRNGWRFFWNWRGACDKNV